MKLLCVADVHARFADFAPDALPDADVCLLAGDLTNAGMRRPPEVQMARAWIDGLRRRFPVFWIPGNHDIGIDWSDFQFTVASEGPDNPLTDRHAARCLLPEAFIRRTEGGSRMVTGNTLFWRLEWRGVSFVGQSLCTACYMPELATQWAYTTADPDVDAQTWADTPPADVVVSHCPPFGILDSAGKIYTPGAGFGDTRHIGSPGLLAYIERHEPRLVVCGHAHQNCGEVRQGRTRIVNTAERWTLVELEGTLP